MSTAFGKKRTFDGRKGGKMQHFFEKNAPFAQKAVLGLPYFDGKTEDALDKVYPYVRARAPFSVFTPGATVAARAEREPSFKELLLRADLLLPDGRGCLFAARLCGTPLASQIAGIDFAEALLSRADGDGLRVFLYGGKAGVAERAAARLRARYGGLIISAADGYGEDPAPRIAAFCPHITCVCLGAGKQEAWIAENKTRVCGVLLGLGGSLDVWSGDVRRAPSIVRRAGLEWAWRTLRAPRRAGRLFPLPAYFLRCLRVGQNAKKEKQNPPIV